MLKRISYLLFTFLVLFSACKSSDTVITITEEAESPFAAQEPEVVQTVVSNEEFIQLNLGLVHPISTFDPLFAYSTAELTIADLVYESLTTFDADGSVVPSLASKWIVSTDSLTYTFTIRAETYYHDSSIFSSGLGRKVLAEDVKYVFERMTLAHVPNVMANTFSNIEGLEPLAHERKLVKNPQQRVLKGISGIEVSNDSTVTIELLEKDSEFLTKLAHPGASIYPKELLKGRRIIDRPVGTGAYFFIKSQNDNLFLLGRNQKFRRPISLSRIDVHHDLSQTDLFQKLAKNEIDHIPILSPDIANTILDTDLSLSPAYTDRFILEKHQSDLDYEVYFNSESSTNRSALIRALENGVFNNKLILDIQIPLQPVDMSLVPLPANSTFYTSKSDDPFIKSTYISLQQRLKEAGHDLKMTDIRIPLPSITMYASDFPHQDQPAFITVKSQVFSISQPGIDGVVTNDQIWWLNLDQVKKNSGEQ